MGITIKEQSERFSSISEILSTWKRWARQFLPPDLYSIKGGVSRELSLNESFELMLAGHLVGEMKFTVPDAKGIIEDLKPWMMENGFYPYCHDFKLKGVAQEVKFYDVIIGRSAIITDTAFGYRIIGHISKEGGFNYEYGCQVFKDTYSLEEIGCGISPTTTTTLHIFSLLSHFLTHMRGLYDFGEIRNFITAKGYQKETESKTSDGVGNGQQEIDPGV